MEPFFQVLVIALVTVIAMLVLKKRVGELALVLAVLSICILSYFAMTMFQPVLDMVSQLEELTGLNTAVMAPVFKTVLIGILTNVAAGICSDSGENGIARMVEICGTVMALYLSIPLISAVLELLDSLLGG